jgi:hypothetical protein
VNIPEEAWVRQPDVGRPARTYLVTHGGKTEEWQGLFSQHTDDDGVTTPAMWVVDEDQATDLPRDCTVVDAENGLVHWRDGRPAALDDCVAIETVAEIPFYDDDGNLERIDVVPTTAVVPRASVEQPPRRPDDAPFGYG